MFISKLAKNPAITFFTIAKYSASSSMGHGSWSPSLKKFHETRGLITPLKNPARRAGGTKPEALVPEALRDGFLRGV